MRLAEALQPGVLQPAEQLGLEVPRRLYEQLADVMRCWACAHLISIVR
jgi:hypothetical protein